MKTSTGWVAPVAIAAALAAPAPRAAAQAEYSLRTRALSPRFAGVVEDLISDAFLNPARLSAFTGTQVYLARNPSPSQTLPYPRISTSYDRNDLVPPEVWPSGSYSYGALPYQLDLFTALGGMRAVFTAAGYASTGEDYVEDDELRSSSAGALNLDENARGTRRETSSIRVEAALSTADSADTRSFGMRLQLAKHSLEDEHVDSHNLWYFQSPDEVAIDARFSRDAYQFDQVEAILTLGMYRPGTMMRGIMVAGGYVRRDYDNLSLQTRSEDNDFDGNGVGMGGSIYQFYKRTEQSGERDYDGPVLRGRFHLDLTDEVVFVVGGSWEYTTGSGPAGYAYNSVLNDAAGGSTAVVYTPYDYDGTDTRYGVYGTLAYRTRLNPDVLLGLGVNLAFARDDFSEDGTGVMQVELTGSAPASEQVDYVQTVWRAEDDTYLRLPAGLEWLPIEPLALRLGLELQGHRYSGTEVSRRTPDTSSLPPDYQRSAEDRRGFSGHSTRILINTGVGVSLAERLFVDLLYQSESQVSLTYFSYASLRFVF